MIFSAACAAVFAVLCLAIPSIAEPDSGGALASAPTEPQSIRCSCVLTALGLSLQLITYVQVAMFCGGLMVLVAALEQASIRRVRYFFLFSCSARIPTSRRSRKTILTESIGFSAIAVTTAFLLDYLRTGRTRWLALAGLFVGLSIAICPAGIVLLPMLVLAAWLKWHRRDVPALVLIAALIVPPAVAVAVERAMHRIEHGARTDSVLPYILVE